MSVHQISLLVLVQIIPFRKDLGGSRHELLRCFVDQGHLWHVLGDSGLLGGQDVAVLQAELLEGDTVHIIPQDSVG